MMTAVEGGYVKYDDTEIDEESLKIIKQELKETEENKKKCLDILKKKLMDKEDLNACLQDDFLLGFIRVSKYDYNKAYQRILRFYEERWNLPDVYKDYSPRSVKIVETARQMYASPYRKKDDKSVIAIIKRTEYDTSKVSYDLIIRAISLVGDMILLNNLTQMCGVTIILDLKSSTWSSSWAEYTPTRIKILARLLQKTVPLRIRSIHVINAPPIYYLIYSLAYPFLSIKIRNRVVVHKNRQSLHSYIDPELLPKEYDGHLEQSDLINLLHRAYEKEDYFNKFSKYGYIKKKK